MEYIIVMKQRIVLLLTSLLHGHTGMDWQCLGHGWLQKNYTVFSTIAILVCKSTNLRIRGFTRIALLLFWEIQTQ